jgi:hypothetical protein
MLEEQLSEIDQLVYIDGLHPNTIPSLLMDGLKKESKL